MIKTSIVIIGAGPAGCTCAMALAKKNIPTTVIDQSSFPRDKICGDALSGKVVLSLKKIDEQLVNQLAKNANVIPSHGVTFVAPNGKKLNLPFRKVKDELNPPGFISKRIDFDNWLFEEVAKEPLITIKTNFRIDDFEKQMDGWKLSNKLTKQSVHANLVVAADGAQSRFAKVVGGIHMEENHFSAGLRAYYKGVKGLSTDGFIELHFLKEFLPGYFWIFPLANGYANVGVGVPSNVVRKKHLNLKSEMLKLIQTNPTIKDRFEKAELVDDIKGYGLPLGSKKRPISGDGFILLGDAASLIDPFTGEGIGNAMISALKASEVIAASFSNADYSAKNLSKYDEILYNRLWPELNLSSKMLQLVKYPWLFNLVINKASRSKTLQETISCMFEDIDMRNKLKDPRFYLKILFE